MRLILFDLLTDKRFHFHPVAINRPIWELRCGITSLGEKLIERTGALEVACFVPDYMAEVYRIRCEASSGWPVNDPMVLTDEDLLLVAGRVRAADFDLAPVGPSCVKVDTNGEVLAARIAKEDLAKLDTTSIESLLVSAVKALPASTEKVEAWNYVWELILQNPDQLTLDFQARGRSGIEGTLEEPAAIRGSRGDVYIAPGALVHPMVVLDAENGPIYLDEDAVVHPFTRIEGPCYVGKGSILLGAKCREGMSIGPYCRIGGEVEESIIQGYSNKYHDGFLGHAYLGEWVNLGAGTTNSDLRNDYGDVSVMLDGQRLINTGSSKVGALMGDHTKVSIGCMFNTGAYVGAMSLVTAEGKLLPRYIPSFIWLIGGAVSKGFGKARMYDTASKAMPRRGCQWTKADERMWDEIYQLTEVKRQPFLEN